MRHDRPHPQTRRDLDQRRHDARLRGRSEIVCAIADEDWVSGASFVRDPNGTVVNVAEYRQEIQRLAPVNRNLSGSGARPITCAGIASNRSSRAVEKQRRGMI
jgi:hypothetical protein